MKNKAAVAKALKDKGIPLPEEDSFDAMMHRLNTWGEGKGYLFRRIKTRFYGRQNLPADIPFGVVVFIPDSDFARTIMRTGAMFPMGRAEYNPDVHALIDVPKTETYTEPKAEKTKVEKKSAPKKATPKKSSSAKVKKDGNNKSNSKSNS
jgi:hypothetical protein